MIVNSGTPTKAKEFVDWAEDIIKSFKKQFLRREQQYSNDFFLKEVLMFYVLHLQKGVLMDLNLFLSNSVNGYTPAPVRYLFAFFGVQKKVREIELMLMDSLFKHAIWCSFAEASKQ